MLIITQELENEIEEKLKTKMLKEIAEEMGYSYSFLCRKLNKFKDSKREECRKRTYNNVPINIFDEFGEICIEINAKVSKEKLSNIKLVLK